MVDALEKLEHCLSPRKPSDDFRPNIYVDTMGPSAVGLQAVLEMGGVDRVLFGTDFGPVPMSLELHIDLVALNTLNLLRLGSDSPHLVPELASA